MDESILNNIKKLLGLASDYTAFDTDIIIHINSVFNTLHQLGVGPVTGFMIDSDTDTWTEFTSSDILLNSVKTYMYLRVRLLFDPPDSSYARDAFDKQAKEIEWRLNVQANT